MFGSVWMILIAPLSAYASQHEGLAILIKFIQMVPFSTHINFYLLIFIY